MGTIKRFDCSKNFSTVKPEDRVKQLLIFVCFFTAIVLVWPANQSRNANVLSRPKENTTILAPSSICNQNPVSSSNVTSNSDQDLVLLVVVCSAMSNFQERKTI